MPEVRRTKDSSRKPTEKTGSVVIGRSDAQKRYEAEINNWVRGRATLDEVFQKDPYRYKPSLTGFLHFLFTGSTRKR